MRISTNIGTLSPNRHISVHIIWQENGTAQFRKEKISKNSHVLVHVLFQDGRIKKICNKNADQSIPLCPYLRVSHFLAIAATAHLLASHLAFMKVRHKGSLCLKKQQWDPASSTTSAAVYGSACRSLHVYQDVLI